MSEKVIKKKIFEINKKNLNFEKCYCPENLKDECSKKIIRSHTVSKSSNLNLISRNNHVYDFYNELGFIFKDKYKATAKLKGINQASTFKVFCSHHDSKLFEDFESKPLEINIKHSFLIYYRTVVQELYKKEISYMNFSDYITKLEPLLSNIALVNLKQYKRSTGQAIRDLNIIKNRLDKDFEVNDYSKIKNYVLLLDKAPPIMSSGGSTPTNSFFGEPLFDLADETKIAPLLTVNSLSLNNHTQGAVFFSWYEELDKDNCCMKLIESLDYIENDKKTLAAYNYIFKNNENIFISPDWWDGLKSIELDLLDKKINNIRDYDYRISDYSNLEDIITFKTIEIKKF